jgi:4-amino-4-deoxy-L-arabinose transferase-like glycosyltransferase
MMTTDARKNKDDLPGRISEWVLILYMVCLAVVYLLISGRRFFDFDEFQVVYASAAILRKGALYSEQIGHHFPFANLVMSLPSRLLGFESAVLIISRYMIFALDAIMLLYTYRIGFLFRGRKAGLLAVCMVLSSFVFLEKGIEIRHDVFNTLFNVMGAYYGIAYLHRMRPYRLMFSAFCFGMALASTQKATVFVGGFLIGVLMYLALHEECRKSIVRVVLAYILLIPTPLVMCLILLVGAGNDTVGDFWHHGVKNIIIGFSPHTDSLYPFPYQRLDMFRTLFFENTFFYVICIAGVVLILLSKQGRRSKRMIIGVWAAVGLVFYITSKRPFFQTFLPAIPPLAIIGGDFLSRLWEDTSRNWKPLLKSVAAMICFIFLFALPVPSLLARVGMDKRFEKALANASFCVENLKEDDRVLCFTQNQIFFDPLMKISDEECGERIYDYDADCFEKKMIQAQCRVIIYDYRTQLLNQEIKRRIAENYIKAMSGDILIPGFPIPPNGVLSKRVWINGSYYSPSLSLEIDGEKPKRNVIRLEQGHHIFKNMTDRPIILVYVFDPVGLEKHLSHS